MDYSRLEPPSVIRVLLPFPEQTSKTLNNSLQHDNNFSEHECKTHKLFTFKYRWDLPFQGENYKTRFSYSYI